MKEKYDAEKYKGSALFQIILLGLFSIALIWVLSIPIEGFTSTDEYPDIIPMTPQKIITFRGSPSDIQVGMHIKDIPEFDTVKGLFTVDLTLWFKFDPTIISLDRISKFTFDSTEVKYKSKPYTRIDGKKLVAHFDMKIIFSSQLSYDNFPFDDHTVSLSLTHNFISPFEGMFKSSKFNLVISPQIKIAGWKIIDKRIKLGYIKDILDPHDPKAQRLHPRIVFSIDFVREGARHIVTILLPLLLVFFIALFTFTVNPKDANVIMGISTAAISAVIAQRFVMASLSPESGSFMISDKIFFLFITACFAIFFINLLSAKITGFYKNIIALILYFFTFLTIIHILKPLF